MLLINAIKMIQWNFSREKVKLQNGFHKCMEPVCGTWLRQHRPTRVNMYNEKSKEDWGLHPTSQLENLWIWDLSLISKAFSGQGRI